MRMVAGASMAMLVGCGVLARGGDEAAPGLPAEIRAELRQTERLPGGRYAAERTWEAESARFGHRVGRAVPDADASGGTSWQALVPPGDGLGAAQVEPGAGAAGYLVFGPYEECPPGDYVAFFGSGDMRELLNTCSLGRAYVLRPGFRLRIRGGGAFCVFCEGRT